LTAAMTYCLAKDRPFQDPLRSVGGVASSAPSSPERPVVTVVQTATGSGDISSTPLESPPIDLASSSLLDLALEDGLSESSDEEEDGDGDDGDKADSEAAHEVDERGEVPLNGEGESASTTTQVTSQRLDKAGASASVPTTPLQPNVTRLSTSATPQAPKSQATSTAPISKTKSENDRPLLLFPNGIVFHDKVFISVSIHHVTVRGTYAESVDGHIQIVAKGVVAEAIWPTVTMVGERSSCLT
jgi:hypothetical protein